MFFTIAWGRLDPDFGWHLVTGRYIIAHGIPRHDFYTYTARGHPWVDHEWGSDIIQALLYRIGGYLFDALFFAIIWTAAVMVYGWRAKLWVVFLAALAILPYAGIRPIAWSVLFFAICLKVLRKGNRRYIWFLPLLFMFWANLHAGFIAGLGLVAYFAFLKRSRYLAGILLLSAGATLINAYGIGLYREIGSTIFDPQIHNQIVEWRRFFIPPSSIPYILAWVIGFIFFARTKWREWLGVGPVLLVATLAASRNLPLLVVATLGDLHVYWRRVFDFLPKQKFLFGRVIFNLSRLLVVLGVFIIATLSIPNTNRLHNYPIAEVSYLRRHPCTGNLFNSYDYGGYLIWKLPNQPVFIDGRMVTWINHMDDYESIVNHPAANYRSQFNKYNIKCALLDRDATKLTSALTKNGWITVVSSNKSVLLTAP